MFEVTPTDIAQLDDLQLRTLVGLLCEAEMRQLGYSTSYVTYGGDQNAKDGGLDVRVNLPSEKSIEGFIPRSCTGFQVKCQDMPQRAIADEICPRGTRRPIITELAERSGAYIIVSSKGSISDSALVNRKKAMSIAVGAVSSDLVLDFYDRTRIATWVRNHPGLIVWVRHQIGRAIQGWEPFQAWAYPAGGVNAEYLATNGVQIRNRGLQIAADLTAEEGLNKIRDLLSISKTAVRLVGLSGVGKTRFVQALFDHRIGCCPLPQAAAIYTNINNEPSPSPFHLASDLISTGIRAVLIIDNCEFDLHRRLSELITHRPSLLSIITIEYDIRDDHPEATEVFEVRAASVELIEKLVQARFRNLSQIDSKAAAEFSGGNARIAIALAGTVKKNGTLATLNNNQLFERLFVQRQARDGSLLKMAQASALVYSFDGDDTSEGNEAELFRIAGVVGLHADDLHAATAELVRRDLAQRRGKMRAILPQALANHLAQLAMQNISNKRIEAHLVDGAPARLTKSFARRLGYLGSIKEARELVGKWLSPSGWIGENIWSLNEFGKSIFQSILPANPEAGLIALEQSHPLEQAVRPVLTGDYVSRALRSLAWDASYFDRCLILLESIATQGEGDYVKEAASVHKSLFFLYLSGTHATAEQRIRAIARLLYSEKVNENELGIAALSAMLETRLFSSDYDFNFGGHSRDYGYYPRTYPEQVCWYRVGFAAAVQFALKDSNVSASVQSTIAAHFRGLWTQVGLHDELESFVKQMASQSFWRDGWLAVKTTRAYDEADGSSQNFARLSKLEEVLRPIDLVQRVQARVLAVNSFYDIDDATPLNTSNIGAAIRRHQETAIALGMEVAKDFTAFQKLLPEIVDGVEQARFFGEGLAEGTDTPNLLWQLMVDQLGRTHAARRNLSALSGFLCGLQKVDPQLVGELLDGALRSETLASHFPYLQNAIEVDLSGVNRLTESVRLCKAPVRSYAYINLDIEILGDAALLEFLDTLSRVPEGEQVALQAVGQLILRDLQNERAHSAYILEFSSSLLKKLPFTNLNQREFYEMRCLVGACVRGPGGYHLAKTIFDNLLTAIASYKTHRFNHDELVAALTEAQPLAALDALLDEDGITSQAGVNLLNPAYGEANALDKVQENLLFDWCEKDSKNRFPALAAVISAFTLSADRNPRNWAPISSRLVHSAPDPVAVMQILAGRLHPKMASGTRSSILETASILLDEFDVRGNLALAHFIAVRRARLQAEARQALAWETKFDREHDLKFE